MARQNIERQKELEPQRIEYAVGQLHAAGIKNITMIANNRLEFEFKNEKIFFYPYSGWASGKSITDGRGLQKLLDQLK